MKKNLLSLLLALSITAGCLSIPAYAETTATDGTEDPAMTETLPDLAQDAQAPQTEYAFGSVSILNGCRTLDGQVPLAGSDRKLESAQAAIFTERVNKAVPVDRGGFQTNYHIVELHGMKCRHDFLRQQFSTS